MKRAMKQKIPRFPCQLTRAGSRVPEALTPRQKGYLSRVGEILPIESSVQSGEKKKDLDPSKIPSPPS